MSPIRFLLAAVLLSSSSAALSATVCVSSVNGLIQAINSYDLQPDGSVLTIKIVQGSYAVGNGLGLNQHHPDRNEIGLQLLGGYTTGCASRQVNPLNTIIDGLNQPNGGLAVTLEGSADALIEGITFTRLNGSTLATAYGGILQLGLETGTGDTASYSIRHCRFVGNAGHTVVALLGSRLLFVNNLVAGNTLSGSEAAAVLARYGHDAQGMLVANNNTIANNSGGAGIRMIEPWGEGSSRMAEINDNILYGNSGADLDLSAFDQSRNPMLVIFNMVGTASGISLGADNLSTDPRFVNAAGSDYRLASNSPAINSGSPIQINGFPLKDITGGPRIVGSVVDRGAYESVIDNTTTAVVTTVADNGNNTSPTAGSLRAAIKVANASGVPFRILFNVAGNCPVTLNLSTPMLDITGDVSIDGTTQSGWTANSTFGRFDGRNCVFVNGMGSTSTPWALHVPSTASSAARLVVGGMIFAGFNDAAVKLEGGRNHRLTDNQFGGIGFTLPNRHAIRVTGNSGGAYIGGFEPADANLIAGSEVGIYLDNAAGGSTVASNVVGFQADGIGSGGNGIGVNVFQSPSNKLQGNAIGNSTSSAITLSGASSSANLVQYNTIGLDYAWNLASNAVGVTVNLGAGNNTIGAPLNGSYGGNSIFGGTAAGAGVAATAGVWVTTTGGNGNRVLANQFQSTAGMDVDLGALGPSPNQSSPSSSGPNYLQSYPVLSHARRTLGPGGTVALRGQLPAVAVGTYRIDVYWFSSCPANGRGRAWYPIGHGFASGFGAIPIDITLPLPSSLALSTGYGVITATATDPDGNTSEVGNCIAEIPADTIFRHGFE